MDLAPAPTNSAPAPWAVRFAQLATVGVFVGFVFLPWLDRRPVAARSVETWELRTAAHEPTLEADWRSLAKYPESFARHFDDTFGYRDWMLRGHSAVKVLGFGVTPNPNFVVGKDGWLYWAGERSFEDYRGIAPFTPKELDDWREALETRRDVLARHGIHYVFAIVPDKSSVYPEHLPDGLTTVGRRRLDQLMEHLRETSDVDVLDLRAAFLDAKREETLEVPLYTKLGTHWNGLGPVVAAEAILRHLRPRFPELAPTPREQLVASEPPGIGDTMEVRMYLSGLVRQRSVRYDLPPDTARVVKDTGLQQGAFHSYRRLREGGPSAFLLHDSFGPQLYPLLAGSFERLDCLWRQDLPLKRIVKLGPDVVVQVRVQRALMTIHPRAWTAGDRAQDSIPVGERVLSIVLPDEVESLEAVGELRLEPGVRDGVPGIELADRNKAAYVALPTFEVAQGDRFQVRLEYWTSRRATIRIVPTRNDATRNDANGIDATGDPRDVEDAERGKSVPGLLAQGAGTLLVNLAPAPGSCRLLLKPFTRNADLQLRSIELYRLPQEGH